MSPKTYDDRAMRGAETAPTDPVAAIAPASTQPTAPVKPKLVDENGVPGIGFDYPERTLAVIDGRSVAFPDGKFRGRGLTRAEILANAEDVAAGKPPRNKAFAVSSRDPVIAGYQHNMRELRSPDEPVRLQLETDKEFPLDWRKKIAEARKRGRIPDRNGKYPNGRSTADEIEGES